MARRGAPALYELLRKSHLATGAPAHSGPADAAGAAPGGSAGKGGGVPPLHRGLSSSGSKQPGQPIMFQVSLLWIVLLAACAVVLVVIAYNIGTRTSGGGPAADANGAPATLGPRITPPAPAPPATIPATPRTPSPTPPPLAATDNNGDPRTKGFKYYVLAHPSTQRAPAMVEFCRANGLDAYLVPDDNAMLTKIVVLPGYRDSSEKSSDPIRKLEAEIKRVGEKWKNAARGNKDFSDAYPEMFR